MNGHRSVYTRRLEPKWLRPKKKSQKCTNIKIQFSRRGQKIRDHVDAYVSCRPGVLPPRKNGWKWKKTWQEVRCGKGWRLPRLSISFMTKPNNCRFKLATPKIGHDHYTKMFSHNLYFIRWGSGQWSARAANHDFYKFNFPKICEETFHQFQSAIALQPLSVG